MPITAMLELDLKPESVPAARDVMRRALQDTRAFDGNLGTDVLVDQDDERTGSSTALGNSRARGGLPKLSGRRRSTITELPALLAAPPVKTRYSTTDVDAMVSTARSPGPPTATPPFVKG